jgi:2Fe-2S ferredoxin
MAAAERAGYRWPTLCHGCAICTRCWIQIAPDQRDHLSPMQPREREALDRVRWRGVEDPSERLACQASPVSDAIVFKEGVSVCI